MTYDLDIWVKIVTYDLGVKVATFDLDLGVHGHKEPRTLFKSQTSNFKF